MTAQPASITPAPLIAPDDIPYLPRGVRLADDRVRGIRVLQAPERAMQLDAIGDAHGRWAVRDGRSLGIDRLEVYERVRPQ